MLKRMLLIALLAFAAQGASARELPDFTGLVAKQGAAVVNISTTQIIHSDSGGLPPGVDPNDPFYQFFHRFAPPEPHDEERRSLGSGFIISHDGYILTNAHVVEGADRVTVRLTDKREFKAKVIGSDHRVDVALIKIDARNLPVVKLGDPNKIKVGEWVVAIGSPFGFDNSVTAGIVSAKGRYLPRENLVPFIQTDAAINPGNSGGPLFDMKGEVIGINSQILTRSGGYMGISFAIPIDVAMDVANQLRTTGKVTRGRIGVAIQEITRELAESFGLPNTRGALVSNVEKGGPADRGGIRASDIILKFDGKPVPSARDLPRIVSNTHPGSKVAVEVWRKGRIKVLHLTVGTMPSDSQQARRDRREGEHQPSGTRFKRIGLTLSELTREQKRQLQTDSGLLVEDARGAAERAGLQPGDVILSLNNEEVSSLRKFKAILKRVPKRHNVALLVKRGGNTSYVAIRLDEKQ